MVSPEQFEKEMHEIKIKYGDDVEIVHIYMDKLLVETLKQLGYEGGLRTYEEQHKWYS